MFSKRSGFQKGTENTEKSQARETFSKKSKKVKTWCAISIEIQHSGIVNTLYLLTFIVNKLCSRNLLFIGVYRNRHVLLFFQIPQINRYF